jgi:hypothetical protein
MTSEVQENYKMKDNYLRLNNVIFPVWFLILFPAAWLVILPANFIIDTIVLVAALKSLKLPVKDQYKRSILWVWIMGFVADLAGSALLLGSQMISGSGEAVRWFRLNAAGLLLPLILLKLYGVSCWCFWRLQLHAQAFICSIIMFHSENLILLWIKKRSWQLYWRYLLRRMCFLYQARYSGKPDM